jgi:hypothetical protein
MMKLLKFTEVAAVIIMVSCLISTGLSQATSTDKRTPYPELSHIFSFSPSNHQPKFNLEEYRFQAQHLPFFCRIEHKIEQKSTIPFRFRIGDLNYVNALENKINTYIFAY